MIDTLVSIIRNEQDYTLALTIVVFFGLLYFLNDIYKIRKYGSEKEQKIVNKALADTVCIELGLIVISTGLTMLTKTLSVLKLIRPVSFSDTTLYIGVVSVVIIYYCVLEFRKKSEAEQERIIKLFFGPMTGNWGRTDP
ncbi:hypothetical protein ACYSNW_08005 [Enterococcus sp. LJL99]